MTFWSKEELLVTEGKIPSQTKISSNKKKMCVTNKNLLETFKVEILFSQEQTVMINDWYGQNINLGIAQFWAK